MARSTRVCPPRPRRRRGAEAAIWAARHIPRDLMGPGRSVRERSGIRSALTFPDLLALVQLRRLLQGLEVLELELLEVLKLLQVFFAEIADLQVLGLEVLELHLADLDVGDLHIIELDPVLHDVADGHVL